MMRPRHSHAARGGFTLLEVMLAAVLAALLMAGMWSLLFVYSRLFQGGYKTTEESGRIHAICRQVENDLRSTVFAERPGLAPGPRAAGLAGGADWLRLDVVQEAPRATATVSTVAPPRGDDAPTSKAPELVTVVYRAELPPRQPAAAALSPARLVRRELSWEASHSGDPESPLPTAGEPVSAAPLALRTRPSKKLSDEPDDDAPLVADEISAINFRYFDGAAWTEAWDSAARGALPVAVEVTLAPRDDEPAQELAAPLTEGRDNKRLSTEPDETVRQVVLLAPPPAIRAPTSTDAP